jgi:hypothetical protein
MKTFLLTGLTILSWLSISTLTQSFQYSLQLQVPALTQSRVTSCGEAVLVMAYNYANPQTTLTEPDVIQYAIVHSYFTPEHAPFTSPANMGDLLKHYQAAYNTGNVTNPARALNLLARNIQQGQPVMIDITTWLDQPYSGAHFVLVTGLSIDPSNDKLVVTVHYNNPLTGRNESAPWDGKTGIWNAWQKNGDPGGAGWWLVISPQK